MSALIELIAETLYYKYIGTLPETTKDLTGRTLIITGSNVGLGLEAAKFFYKMNPARMILAVRTISKGEDAKKVIEAQTNTKGQTKVEVWELDMALFESVKRFAKKCHDELDRVDVVLLNAAVGVSPWSVTRDGWENSYVFSFYFEELELTTIHNSLQVNVISAYMLAALMAPLVQKTATLLDPHPTSPLKPHLVIVASDGMYSKYTINCLLMPVYSAPIRKLPTT
jgi:retinol dehydrogenase 12